MANPLATKEQREELRNHIGPKPVTAQAIWEDSPGWPSLRSALDGLDIAAEMAEEFANLLEAEDYPQADVLRRWQEWLEGGAMSDAECPNCKDKDAQIATVAGVLEAICKAAPTLAEKYELPERYLADIPAAAREIMEERERQGRLNALITRLAEHMVATIEQSAVRPIVGKEKPA